MKTRLAGGLAAYFLLVACAAPASAQSRGEVHVAIVTAMPRAEREAAEAQLSERLSSRCAADARAAEQHAALRLELAIDARGHVRRSVPQLVGQARAPALDRWRECASRALWDFPTGAPAGTIVVAVTTAPAPTAGAPPREPGARAVATVRVGAIQVEGALPADVVTRVVEREHGQLLACYERELREWRIEGAVSLSLAVGESGTVTTATVRPDEPELERSGVPACIELRSRRWRFPAAADATRITVTIDLVLDEPRSR